MSEMLTVIAARYQLRANWKENVRQRSPYYPKYIEGQNGDEYWISTLLRREKDGIWYTEHHYTSMIGKKDYLYEEFQKKIYFSLLYGKVDPKLENMEGNKLWKKDKLQISEYDRFFKR